MRTQYILGFINEIAKTDQNIAFLEEGRSHYNEEFVKEIQKSRTSKGKVINPEDLWK